MKKILAISSVLLGVLFLAGCSQQPVSQVQPTASAPVTQKPAQPIKNKIDTSRWETLDDATLKINLKYPSSCGINGIPSGGNSGIMCDESDKNTYLLFEDLSLLHPSFPKLNISEIADIYHKAMEAEASQFPNRFLGSVSEVTVNGRTAYQFSFDTAYCLGVFKEDYSCGGGSLVEEPTTLVFIESDKKKKILLTLPRDNATAQAILETFLFID